MLPFRETECDTRNGLTVYQSFVIDCGRCKVVFPEIETDGVELMSTQKVLKELKKGSYLFHGSISSRKEEHRRANP